MKVRRSRLLVRAAAEATILAAGPPLTALFLRGSIPAGLSEILDLWGLALEISSVGAILSAITAARSFLPEGDVRDAVLRIAATGIATLSLLVILGLGDPTSLGVVDLSAAVGRMTVNVRVNMSPLVLLAMAAAAVDLLDGAAELVAALAST